MEFGLHKSAKATFFRGKLPKATNNTLDTTTIIKDLESKESYKYLAVTEEHGIQHSSRGLVQLELFLKTSIIGLDTYLNNTNNWMLKLVKT